MLIFEFPPSENAGEDMVAQEKKPRAESGGPALSPGMYATRDNRQTSFTIDLVGLDGLELYPTNTAGAVIKQLLEILTTLSSQCTDDEFGVVLDTLLIYVTNVLENPDEIKYQVLRALYFRKIKHQRFGSRKILTYFVVRSG